MGASFGPKLHTRERLIEMCRAALASDTLTSGEAAKIRGLAMWLDNALEGRSLRGAMHGLTASQYWHNGVRVGKNSNLGEALKYIIAAARKMADRSVSLIGPVQPPVCIYTDASADSGGCRLGVKILHPEEGTFVAVYDPPAEVTRMWGPQLTIINQAELQCATLVPATFHRLIAGRDVIWWVDNTSAETSMVKAGSPTVTMARLALQASAMLAGLRCRVWWEYVPSGDNPSDVLSRDGYQDAEVAKKVREGEWHVVQPVCPTPFACLSYEQLWEWGQHDPS